MKGIGILLMILGHCMPFGHPINRFIYSFHMPLFFVLSGYVYNIKYKDLQKEFLFKKLKMLLYFFIIPTFTIMLLSPLVFKLGFYEPSFMNLPEKYTYVDLVVQYFKALFYKDTLPALAGQLWFVRTLFIISIIFNFLNNLFKTEILKKQLIVSIVSCSIIWYLNSTEITSLGLNIFLSYPFFYLGYVMKEKNVLGRLDSLFLKNNYFILITPIVFLFMFLFSLLYPHNIIDFYSSNIESSFFLVIMVFSGLLLTYLISKILGGAFLEFFGKNSIHFLIIHVFILKFITLAIVSITGESENLLSHYVPTMDFKFVLIYFIITSLVSYSLIFSYLSIKNKVISKNKR